MNLFRLKNGNSTNHKFTQRALLLIPLALACFPLLPQALAVVPPPDGGYPGFNTAEGHNALVSLYTGAANTAVGWFSLGTTDGSFNTATGAGSLLRNVGNANAAFGAAALLSNFSGNENTAVGTSALLNALGNTNTALGSGAGQGVTTASNVICIGAPGANVDNSCYIGHIYGASIDPTNSLVGVDLNGKLGVTTSARRFKRDIQPMENASEAILALKPVRFHYKGDVKSIPCFGLVAEDVEKVNPDLIVRDKNGEPLSVRYEQINAMLLNEFLKARRQIDAQQEQINALIAGLQKVSAQLEVSKPAPQTVLNDQ